MQQMNHVVLRARSGTRFLPGYITRFAIFVVALAIVLIPSPDGAQQVVVAASQGHPWRPSAEVLARVDALLQKMTLQEKIGQLVQYSGGSATGPSPKRGLYEEMIRRGEVGSLLNVTGKDCNDLQRIAVEQSRLHIPLLFGYDVIHGYRATAPVPLGLAAAFSPELVERVARQASDDAASEGVHWLFSPMVDISRDARWGRTVESAGEDTYLDAALTRAWVRGIQHPHPDGTRSAACIKHFAAYGAPFGGRDYNAVDMSARLLEQVYLPPYRAGIDAGALTVMSSFNALNGVPMTANNALLSETLRRQWGFHGLVVSDWGAVRELMAHSVARSKAEAAAKAITAGVDMDMEGDVYQPELAELVRTGKVPIAVVDEAVRRVLGVKLAVGLFEHPYAQDPGPQPVSSSSRLLARVAATQSLVLLKNDNFDRSPLLPLDTGKGKIALIGPLADSGSEMLGSWSAPAAAQDVVTLRQALAERLKERLLYAKGTEIDAGEQTGFAEARRVAAAADLVIMALGESGPSMTGESTSRAHLGLPGNQQQLLETIVQTGKPVVLVLFNGRPLAIPWAARNVSAILESWYPGIEAGPAIADVLLGDAVPSGHLPVTMPYAVGQEPLFYAQYPTGRPAVESLFGPVQSGTSRFNSRYIDEATVPLYPFGWGLSYTFFQFATPRLSKDTLTLGEIASAVKSSGGDAILAEVETSVTNTGKRAATAVPQFYLRNVGASVEQPLAELRGFTRVNLEPGETRHVRFAVRACDLAFLNQKLQSVIEPTEYRIAVGPDSTTTNVVVLRILPGAKEELD